MAVTPEHQRTLPFDLYRTARNDRLSVVASRDRSPRLDPADQSWANALLHTLQAIQRERTLLGRLERLVEAVVDLLQRTDVAVAVLDETGDTFEVAAATGRLLAARGRRATVLDNLISAVVRRGQSLLLGDVRLDPEFSVDMISSAGNTWSWLGVPLLKPTGAFGALVVVDITPHAFRPDDEQALSALASLASAALDDARSLELARRGPERGDEREQGIREFANTAADRFWEQDEYLRFTWFSSRGQRKADPWTQSELGKTWHESATRDVAVELVSRHELDLDARRPFRDFRYQRQGDDGSVRMLDVSEKPAFEAQGVLGGYRDSITDVTEEHEFEVVATEASGALATRSSQVAAVAELGQFALAADDVQDVLNAAAMVVAGVFDADCSQILRLRPDGSTLLIEAGLALPGGLAVSHAVKCEKKSQYGYALAVGEPVIVTDLAREDRFRPMPSLLERGMVSGVLVPIARPGRSYGLLGVHARRAIHFADEDVQFLRSVANVLATTIDAAHSRHVAEALIEQAPDAIARYDSELRLISANLALGLAIGRPVSELSGQTIRTLSGAPSPQVDNWETIARSVLRSGREREAEFNWPTPFGDRDYQMRFIPELGANGEAESFLVVARDVTDRKRLHDERAAIYEELLGRDLRLRELIGDLRIEHREERAQDRRLAEATYIKSQMTAREVEILGMVVAGLTNKEVAARLNISAGTVRNRLGLLYPKLDVTNRAQAAARAVELDLVTPHGD
jgi:GAF domain-containing protein/DNA-binding CsgD family transcriptional regulator